MPVQFRDYYETLGVSKTAAQDEIKSAFRKLARKFHPDTAADKKTAEEKFKEINEAYEVLGDPEKRKKYDNLGPNWEQGGFAPPPRGGRTYRTQGGFPGGGEEFHFGGTGFSDFFEQIFGARGGRGGGFSGYDFEERPTRGQDVEADILVTLEEAFSGSTRQISFRRGDSGKIQTYTVKIPKGVREGQRIRMAGQGEEGAAGGEAGDLYLRVKFQKHPDFEVQGEDLTYELEIPAYQAVLGADVEIPTLEGRARLHIPEGTQNGKKFRLSKRGLPGKDGERGNFYAVVSVLLPEHPSAAEKEIWQKLASL
jgi:curved DNA-binding protein